MKNDSCFRVRVALGVFLGIVGPLLAAGPIGINIGHPEFVDVIKNINGYGSTVPKEKLATDANGWPTADFQVTLFDSRFHMPWNDNGKDPKVIPRDESGTYHLSFTGKASITPSEPGMCAIQNQKYDERTDTTMADLVVPKGGLFVVLKFTDTHCGTEGGVKNLRCLRPGYPANTQQLFTDRFVKGLEPFDTLRLMDFLSTNSHSSPSTGKGYPKLEEWKDRRLPTDAGQGGTGGKFGDAWEYGIALGNQLKKNIWICVPVAASDDYIEKLAQLLKNDIDPSLAIYVEYSNEVWNWGFCQSWWNKAKGEALHAAASQPGENVADLGYNHVTHYGARTAQIAVIFRKVFGEAAMISRIRPVLCWQEGDANSLRSMLEFIAPRYGEPRKLIYGIAFAPYLESKDCSSVDACIEGMTKHTDYHAQIALWTATIAKQFGVHLISYEGGPGLSGEKDMEFKVAANRDPRIAEVIKHFLLEGWFPSGGEMFVQYSYCSTFGRYGCWGSVEPTYDLTNPKYQAYLEVLKALQPKLSRSPRVPVEVSGKLTLDQTQALGHNFKPETAIRFNLENHQPRLDYAFIAEASGTYTIAISNMGNDPKDTGELTISVDDQSAQARTLPATLTVNLKPGLHGLFVQTKGRKTFGGNGTIVITRSK